MPGSGRIPLPVIDVEFISRLEPPTTLREIKESGEFDDWALVRQSRLSTMTAPDSICALDPKVGYRGVEI